MNKIQLKGVIDNITYSHTIGTIDYDKAELIVPKYNGEDILQLRFKHYSNIYNNGDSVSLVGNIRSYSEKLENKNKVHLYVFTYFDKPEDEIEEVDVWNSFNVDGRICKIDELRTSVNGKQNIHFILANNIISKNTHQKLNTYIPMVAFGDTAREIAKLQVSDRILVTGKLNSREYIKKLDNGIEETKMAYEGIVSSFVTL